MRRKALLIAAALLAFFIQAHAQIPFEYRELGACSHSGNPYATNGALQVRRAGPGQVLLATVPLNCGSRVKVTVEDGRPIYVNIVDLVVKGQPIAICNCMRRFEITLKGNIPAGATIWLLGNGRGAASTITE